MRSRVPSVRTIREGLRWLDKVGDPDKLARDVRKILVRAASDPANQRLGGAMSVNAAWDALDKVNNVLQCFGVEGLAREPGQPSRHLYVNTGETYTATIVFSCETRSFRVTSWGDVVEADERRGIKYQ